MSTRCNILVEVGETRLYLYRHHDGYLAGAGREVLDLLVEALQKPDSPSRFVESLLRSLLATYEVTSGWHGDIEYAYRVVFGERTGGAYVGYVNEYGPPKQEIVVSTPEAFAEAVTRDESAMQAHIAALKQQGRVW